MHPASLIFLWLLLAVTTQVATLWQLGIIAVVLLSLLCCQRARPLLMFLRLSHRSRWLLFSLLLVYAVSENGNAQGSFPAATALFAGAVQAGRLLLMLAAVALLLSWMTREQLLAGLYSLLLPLQKCGVNAERIAVRLWLTLHYADMKTSPATALKPAARISSLRHAWQQHLRAAFETPSSTEAMPPVMSVSLPQIKYTWRDSLALCCGTALAAACLL